MNESVPAVLMRGGTSKGLFFHRRDLPTPGPDCDAILRRVMGSPDPMQIDGLGGTYSSTSKVVIVEAGDDPASVKYWFAQVGVDTDVVDWNGNCGNLTVAVGAFAIDEGLVPAVEPVTILTLTNMNTGVTVRVEAPVADGRAATVGDHAVAGVPGTGAPVVTRFLSPGGAVTGSAFPLGQRFVMDGPRGPATVSVVDVAHPYAIARAEDFSISLPGAVPAQLNADEGLLRDLEAFRGCIVEKLGLGAAAHAALLSPVVPRLLLVSEARPDDATVEVLAVSLQKVHRALPVTGSLCGAAACLIPGTVAHEVAGSPTGDATVRLRHPLGVAEVLVQTKVAGPGSVEIESVGTVSTARRLFAGEAYTR